jgi:hypothetical protein
MTSDHQLYIVNSTPSTPSMKTQPPNGAECIHMIAPDASVSADIEPMNGQMLGGRM